MNSTIDYYNTHADEYYQSTVAADLDAARKKFAAYLQPEARIIDVGCGSGRDVLAFRDMGFDAEGIDASEELVWLATERLGITANVADMSDWIADEAYDGTWCCASLMHLNEEDCERFFSNLKHNLRKGGVLYISVKTGIETGTDAAGRYFRDFNEEDIQELINRTAGLRLSELWHTDDTLSRRDFRWLNVIAEKKKTD
jgi:2-polyprenyl-3-methyl-5-hydroxy-6-metoxy-1,4-benzoquinol methylase